MTKAEQFDRAWKLAFHQDTSLVDKIYHPDYKAIDHRWGIEVTIDSDRLLNSRLQNSLLGDRSKRFMKIITFYVFTDTEEF